MKSRLICCSSCERYVRCTEVKCPFCQAALPLHVQADVPRALVSALAPDGAPAGFSRAAVFAMRAALVAAAAPGALGCGADDGTQPREQRDVVASAGAGAASAGGSGGSGQSGGGQGGAAAGGSSGAPATFDLGGGNATADAGAVDAGNFAPVPIYGGVFPDPVTRARV